MRQVFQEVTDKLIHQLKEIQAGNEPARWFKPWTASGMPQFPTNQLTSAEYKGINALLLHMTTLGHGFRTNRWMTFKQKDTFNSQHESQMRIRKGEHGFPIFKYVEWVPKGTPKDKENERKQMALRKYTVFNVDQMEDVPDGYVPAYEPPGEAVIEARHYGAQMFLDQLPCPMEHSEVAKAFYVPSKHLIRMPMKGTFKSEEDYLATLFHEHVHSTGKELERDMTGTMGTAAYAKEELIAEIGAALLCAHFGIAAPMQHPQYINGYIKELQDHTKAFWNAANQAQKAVNLLMEATKDV